MKHLYKTFVGAFALLLFTASCDDDKDLVIADDTATTSLSVSSTTIELSEENQGNSVLDLNWTAPDFGYNAEIDYTLYFDVTGNDFQDAVAVAGGNDMSLSYLSENLNSLVVNSLGGTPFTPLSVDIKLEASISDYYQPAVSNIITINVIPYENLIEPTSWGIVGSAAPNGWDGPDVPFWYTDTEDVYVAYTTLIEGEIKFRENNAWDLNYGDNEPDGTLEEGGSNIAVEAGTYKITFDISALTYTIEPYSWGLVGDATTNGWDGPDMQMSYDGTIDMWTIDATLTSGEFKFRFNNTWDLNYGDTDVDNTLDNGGDNIAVSSGNYHITMDLNQLTYTIEESE
ncbi:SusE outer membrane protein [Pustulibacterium marinum]|uniref:SusE outer membrane protein n=1 Tax=Pustulibacterium marinum TaxID=1224947 RepID=A0A1I7EYZ4_9FLAO|nr:SusE domain-containing protein [Pustulibacterium marinum]SFU29158.1 SusE outer membrane protein [Pustulibacterium marinum]